MPVYCDYLFPLTIFIYKYYIKIKLVYTFIYFFNLQSVDWYLFHFVLNFSASNYYYLTFLNFYSIQFCLILWWRIMLINPQKLMMFSSYIVPEVSVDTHRILASYYKCFSDSILNQKFNVSRGEYISVNANRLENILL